MTCIPVSKRTRLINWCVDTALCGLIFLAIVRLSFPQQSEGDQLRLLKYAFLLLNFAYYLFCESALGTTAGQWLTGTRILSFDESAPSFTTILIRTASRFIPFEPLAIFFSSSGQTLHDHFSGTKTIHKQKQIPNTMKQTKTLVLLLLIATIGSSCATILGGKRTTYQTTKPSDGQPQRKVRVGYIVVDALLTGGLGLIIDFATGAIYKPSAEGNKTETEAK